MLVTVVVTAIIIAVTQNKQEPIGVPTIIRVEPEPIVIRGRIVDFDHIVRRELTYDPVCPKCNTTNGTGPRRFPDDRRLSSNDETAKNICPQGSLELQQMRLREKINQNFNPADMRILYMRTTAGFFLFTHTTSTTQIYSILPVMEMSIIIAVGVF